MAYEPIFMTNCCFCIKLKAAVVIISLLWLIEGIFGTVNNILILASSDNGETNVYSYVSVFTIPITIIYGLIMIGAVFGLYVLTCANTSKMLLIYSKVAYAIAGLESIFRILTIIVIVINKSAFLEDCTNSIENTSSRVEYSSDACNQGYTYTLTFAIAFGIVVILLSLYFAMAVSSYAHKRKYKEELVATKFPTFLISTFQNASLLLLHFSTNMSTSTETKNYHVLADFSVIPIGAEVNTTKYIVECQKILLESGLNFNLHANGTNVEGNYEQVTSAIRKCIDKMHQMGIPRCDTNIRLNTRTDKKVTMQDSIRVVNDKLNAYSGA